MSGDTAALEHVAALERRLLDPDVRARPAEVTALLHPEFLEFGVSGWVWDGASIIDALVAEPGTAFHISELEAHRLAPDVVLVTYRAEPPEADGASLRSTVWVRDAGTWRARFHQGTPVEPR
jgi:ribonuclease HI